MTPISIQLAIAVPVIAIMAKMFKTPAPNTFAFDKTFPEDGSTWKFEVIMDNDATALTEKEYELLDKLHMSPAFRCGDGFFGERWIGRGLFTSLPDLQPLLLRMYKLVLEDASPPDENTLIVRHKVLGIKAPLTWRHDKFTCTGKKKNGVCTRWDSLGFVGERFTLKITKGATSNPYYKQRLTLVPKSDEIPKVCPLVKESFWCLYLFCPTA